MNGKHLPVFSYNEQALLIKKLGFDGIEYKEPKGFVEAIDTLNNHGLKMLTNYSKFDLENFYISLQNFWIEDMFLIWITLKFIIV